MRRGDGCLLQGHRPSPVRNDRRETARVFMVMNGTMRWPAGFPQAESRSRPPRMRTLYLASSSRSTQCPKSATRSPGTGRCSRRITKTLPRPRVTSPARWSTPRCFNAES